jgi:hypothetical protein
MGHILLVHEAHMCCPMHHRALILPPVPPLTNKHRQAAATSGHRGRSEAATILVAHRQCGSGRKLKLVSPSPLITTPSPAPVATAPSPAPAAAAPSLAPVAAAAPYCCCRLRG